MLNSKQSQHGVSPAAESKELARFVSEFEEKILRPVREKRAASDEVMAMQSVASGVSFALSSEERSQTFQLHVSPCQHPSLTRDQGSGH